MLTNVITAPYNVIEIRDSMKATGSMAHIENRFGELLAEKKRRDKKKWTYEDISAATNVSPGTLVRFARQQHSMFDAKTLASLCEFFECEIGDLLVVVADEDDPGRVAALAAS